MIGSFKNSTENYPKKWFGTQEKETRVDFNPGLSANRPSNNKLYTQVQIEDQARNKGFKTVLSRFVRFVMKVRLITLTFLR